MYAVRLICGLHTSLHSILLYYVHGIWHAVILAVIMIQAHLYLIYVAYYDCSAFSFVGALISWILALVDLFVGARLNMSGKIRFVTVCIKYLLMVAYVCQIVFALVNFVSYNHGEIATSTRLYDNNQTITDEINIYRMFDKSGVALHVATNLAIIIIMLMIVNNKCYT
ncbi:unnamed protein product [Medioppia subpectinata]|uniref:Uncharacterized protein n=1 Tax=Medioppia subpectinata TaxID=1979941 RepID=A0A7R9L5M7_9ACAR|nr:unnamed protein product [Medioppia subpectinata]CAG2115774.1 unnamed protein product [Medioppia subpectinata]